MKFIIKQIDEELQIKIKKKIAKTKTKKKVTFFVVKLFFVLFFMCVCATLSKITIFLFVLIASRRD